MNVTQPFIRSILVLVYKKDVVFDYFTDLVDLYNNIVFTNIDLYIKLPYNRFGLGNVGLPVPLMILYNLTG